MPLVVDTAAIVSLAFTDESPAFAQSVIEAIAADGAIVPTLFWYEVRNTLVVGERRKRITPEQTQAFLANLDVLPFEVDDLPRAADAAQLAHAFDLVRPALHVGLRQVPAGGVGRQPAARQKWPSRPG